MKKLLKALVCLTLCLSVAMPLTLICSAQENSSQAGELDGEVSRKTEAPQTTEPGTQAPETQAEQSTGCKSVLFAGSALLLLAGCALTLGKKRD